MRLRSGHLAGMVLLAAVVLGCNLSKSVNTNGNANVLPSPTATETPTPTPKPTPQSIVDTLRRNPGKYPYELKLMENKDNERWFLIGRDAGSIHRLFDALLAWLFHLPCDALHKLIMQRVYAEKRIF